MKFFTILSAMIFTAFAVAGPMNEGHAQGDAALEKRQGACIPDCDPETEPTGTCITDPTT